MIIQKLVLLGFQRGITVDYGEVTVDVLETAGD